VIVFSNNDQRELLHRGEVQSLVKRTGTHASVADISNGDRALFLHASGQQDAIHYRNHVPEMGDWANETFVHVAKVNIKVASAGRPPGLRHILGKDVARFDPLHQHGAKIANQRGDEILLL
jgi:hypothetical protein